MLLRVTNHIYTESRQPLVLRIAGGWVRDKLLGLESHDIDVAVDKMTGYELAQHVNGYLTRTGQATHSIAKIQCNPEKSKHLETATTQVLGQLVDFVNLRSEHYQESRIPVIRFGTPLEDALRRDITINALFYNIQTGEVEDFTQLGLKDLREGVVRTPMDPMQTFSDDPLRVLRVLRFASRFNYRIEAKTGEALRDSRVHRELLEKVSRERVGTELIKMVEGQNPAIALRMILEYGLYPYIFQLPEGQKIEEDGVSLRLTKQLLQLSTRREVVLACFLHPFSQMTCTKAGRKPQKMPATQWIVKESLKLSNHLADSVVRLQKYAPLVKQQSHQPGDRRQLGLLIREIGEQWADVVVYATAIDLTLSEETGVAERYKGFSELICELGLEKAYEERHLVDGKTVCQILDLKPGPQIKGIMDRVMDWQLMNPKATKKECEEYLLTLNEI